MTRARAVIAALVLVCAVLLGASPAVAAPLASAAVGGELTPTGSAAIGDLRTCLASNDTLNVYYLIDNSTSLRVADDGGPGSDPDTVRASILANSLRQLGALPGTTVNWGAGFFSSDFSVAVPWSAWTDDSPAELEEKIESTRPQGYTNWPAAIDGAQQQLAAQNAREPGCQVLIWLTDGQIDIQSPDGQGAEDRDAINRMCGAQAYSGAAAPDGHGVFNALRQSGVVVFGTLLNTNSGAAAASGTMQALVEGSGSLDGAALSCGQQPMPSTYVNGAFVEASGPSSLAQVFLQLGAQVGGGYPQPFDSDGRFWIDEGVARFRIILGSGAWTLTPPAGSARAPASDTAPQDWAVVTGADGATVVDVRTVDAAAQGRWQLASGDVRSLFLFSDLTIVFDPKNEIDLDATGQASASITGSVTRADGTPVDLTVYGEHAFEAWIPGADGQRDLLAGAELDAETGDFTLPLPSDLRASEVVVTATIDPLVTAAHRLALAPVSAQQRIVTVLPSNFPRVDPDGLPVQLSTLEGSDGAARGVMTVIGPEDGGDGAVCVGDDVTIVSDAAERGDSWAWDLTSDLDDGCIAVPQGSDGVDIAITAANPVAADSAVRASVPVTFVSNSGDELTQEVSIAFRTTHPVNEAAVGFVALLLLVLGVLIPLALLWIINRLTTKLDIEQNTQRAALPVRIGPSGVSFPGVPTEASALSSRFAYQPPRRNVRSLRDPDLGEFRGRVPWFPIGETWYELVPPAAVGVAAAHTSSRAGSRGDRGSNGIVRFRNLPLDSFWAVIVRRDELLRTQRGDEVSATAVIYHRPDPGAPDQYRQRLTDIAVNTSLADSIDRLRGELKDAAPAGAQQSPSGGPPRASTPAPPPAAGGATPPPPSRGGPPPPRGSTPPPTATGGSAPPPPPPRRGR